MELQTVLHMLKRRALLILIVAAVVLAIAVAVGFTRPPSYTARATIRVLFDTGIPEWNQRDDYNNRLLNSYAYLIKTRPIVEQALAKVAPRATLKPEDVQAQISTEVVPFTELINITVENENPTLARDLVNALGTTLLERTQSRYSNNGIGVTQLMDTQLSQMKKQLDADRAAYNEALTKNATLDLETLKDKISIGESVYNRMILDYQMARLNQSLQASSITLAEPAILPTQASNAMGWKDIVLGLIIGLAAGIGLALLLENLGSPLPSPENLQSVPAPIASRQLDG